MKKALKHPPDNPPDNALHNPSPIGPVRTGLPPVASNRGLAMGLVVISSVVISFGGLIIRSMEAAGPWQINFYRSIALFGVTCGYIAFRFRGRAWSAIGGIGALGVLGGVFLGLAGIAFLQALSRTTVANTLFILGAIPFFAAAMARIVLHEKLNRATMATMLAAAAGLSAMMLEGIGIGSGLGNMFALLTALLFASYAVVLRLNRHQEMVPALLVAALLIVAIASTQAENLVISARDLALCFFWGGVLSGVANWLFIYASRHLAAAEVTLFMLLEIALGPLWVWWAMDEAPSRWTLIGGALIMLAVAVRASLELLAAKRRRRRLDKTSSIKLDELN